MIIRNTDLQSFRAGDLTHLKEVLHPRNQKLDLPYSLAFAYLEKGETSLLHSLKECEVYFIISGQGSIKLGDKLFEFKKGDCVVVPPDVPQSVENTGDERLEFICIVSPPWTESGETILSD